MSVDLTIFYLLNCIIKFIYFITWVTVFVVVWFDFSFSFFFMWDLIWKLKYKQINKGCILEKYYSSTYRTWPRSLDWNGQKPHLYILIFDGSGLILAAALLPPALVEGSLIVKPLGTLLWPTSRSSVLKFPLTT